MEAAKKPCCWRKYQNLLKISLLASLGFYGCKLKNRDQAAIKSLESKPTDICGNTWTRDLALDPALAVFNTKPNQTLHVLGDIHGASNAAFELLSRAKLVSGTLEAPQWTGGTAILIIAGDLINKGKNSLQALKFLMAIETQAQAAGGKLVAMLGNHDVAFLADPFHPILKSFQDEIAQAGLDICKDIHGPQTLYGAWLRKRPIAALVNGIFISHSGTTQEKTVAELTRQFEDSLNKEGWDSIFNCGSLSDGFFNTNYWWELDSAGFVKFLKPMGAKQVLFAHDPQAFNVEHNMLGYFADDQGHALIKLDMEMFKTNLGVLYRCRSFLADGGCAKHEMLNARNSQFENLVLSQQPPPLQIIRKEKGNWCVGEGNQRQLKTKPKQ